MAALPARWFIPPGPGREAEALARSLGIQLPAASVLFHRGYRDAESARRFLRASLDDLHDPFLLRDMNRAAARLAEAVRRGEKVLLYGDYDVDGATAVVILKTAIELAGGKALHHIPNRLRDGYGMRAEVLEQAAADGVRLVVSADTGIRAADAVRAACRLGLDVVITDHHLPEAELPPALAVLNPNRPGCAYPEKNLCGAGVALKLAQALFAVLEWPAARARRVAASLLKLAAIATVADVVPLTGENRVIVKQGLDGLRSVRNPGLRALLDASGVREGEAPSAGQVAFRVAPRMNAAGRMADANGVIDLFFTRDEARAREIAAQLHALNQERQQAEQEIVEHILAGIEREPVGDRDAALVFSGVGWHRGVVGIVASRLMERFHRPVLVLSEDVEQDLAQGSGRSVPGFHLLEALESMADLLLRFGGHRQAAGLAIARCRVGELRERFRAYAAERLQPGDFRPTLEFDASIDFRQVTAQSVEELLSLAPFGFGNPQPLLAACDVEVAGDPVVFGERHLRLRLRQDGRYLTAKAWGFAPRIDELRPGTLIDAALTFEQDAYSLSRGYAGWCAVLRDLRPAAGAAPTRNGSTSG